MNLDLSTPTTDEYRRLQILISQRLEFVKNQLELFNTQYPRSSGSDLIVEAYLKEQKELISIKEKILGGRNNGNKAFKTTPIL